MIFVVNLKAPVIPVALAIALISKAMIEINNAYGNCTVDGERSPGTDRLTLGSALLAVFGLSLFGWAVVLAPLVAIFHR